MSQKRVCPDCHHEPLGVGRREFLKTAGATAVAISSLPVWIGSPAHAEPSVAPGTPESLVKQLYESLKDEQRQKMCHEWDYVDPQRGLLRTRVANNWHINNM